MMFNIFFHNLYISCIFKIGIRLAMLDVLNSLELEKVSGPSIRLLRTLDRIIACTKSVRSTHALPVIEVRQQLVTVILRCF